MKFHTRVHVRNTSLTRRIRLKEYKRTSWELME